MAVPTQHHIELRNSSERVRVEKDGELLAESDRAVVLLEGRLPARYYLPREDVMAPVEEHDRQTHCPFKGDASYFTVGGHEAIAWYYPDPLPEMARIKDLVAFYSEKTDITLDGLALAAR